MGLLRFLGRSNDERILDDVEQLAYLEMRHWRGRRHALRESGTPTATGAGFRSIPLMPGGPAINSANQTTVTGGTTITALWDAATLTPISANFCRGGEVFKITIFGVMTTAVTGSQTVTLTPIWGTTTGGTSLGASVAAPLEAKVFTNTQWIAQMYVQVRQAGSSGVVACAGNIEGLPFVGAAAGTVEGGTVPFGTSSTTPTTVNTTTAGGLLLAVTPSLATQSYTALVVVPESLN
jgi:hypothetical protein